MIMIPAALMVLTDRVIGFNKPSWLKQNNALMSYVLCVKDWSKA